MMVKEVTARVRGCGALYRERGWRHARGMPLSLSRTFPAVGTGIINGLQDDRSLEADPDSKLWYLSTVILMS